MSRSCVKERLLWSFGPMPAGYASVDSPVTAANDVFGASPYAMRSWLYEGMP